MYPLFPSVTSFPHTEEITIKVLLTSKSGTLHIKALAILMANDGFITLKVTNQMFLSILLNIPGIFVLTDLELRIASPDQIKKAVARQQANPRKGV